MIRSKARQAVRLIQFIPRWIYLSQQGPRLHALFGLAPSCSADRSTWMFWSFPLSTYRFLFLWGLEVLEFTPSLLFCNQLSLSF